MWRFLLIGLGGLGVGFLIGLEAHVEKPKTEHCHSSRNDTKESFVAYGRWVKKSGQNEELHYSITCEQIRYEKGSGRIQRMTAMRSGDTIMPIVMPDYLVVEETPSQVIGKKMVSDIEAILAIHLLTNEVTLKEGKDIWILE